MNLTKSSEQASRPWKSIKIKIKNSFQIASEQFYLQETHDHRSIHIQICSSPEANPNANQQTPRYKLEWIPVLKLYKVLFFNYGVWDTSVIITDYVHLEQN